MQKSKYLKYWKAKHNLIQIVNSCDLIRKLNNFTLQTDTNDKKITKFLKVNMHF